MICRYAELCLEMELLGGQSSQKLLILGQTDLKAWIRCAPGNVFN